ncbi:hypothetical protein [Ekhidna sp.]|uniref:hypothetical protein n=1 Tax=Ekhidna sp. TaxID=2608089 RepID=UPI003CCBE5F7
MAVSKSEVHKTCKDYLEKKIEDLQAELDAVRESAIAETKSSMGDKYETGREMMMQERNRLGKQLDLLTDQRMTLDAIDAEKHCSEVAHGCLVFTDKSVFFLGAALGQIQVGEKQVFVISGNAPISKEMEGKKEGDSFTFNGVIHSIEKIE